MNHAFAVIDQKGRVRRQLGRERYPLYSITKTIIAALIIDLGVDISSPASDWLDKSWVPRGADMNVRQLLNHTSGLRDYFSVADYRAAVETGGAPWSDDKYANHTLRAPLLFEPGEGWAYSNSGFWLLKRICEVESDSSFASLVKEQINKRLGLPSLKVENGIFSDRLPTYQAGWVWHGLVSGTAEDLARFMASPLTSALAKPLVPVPDADPTYPNAAYALGVMGDLNGTKYGHNGSGPGFSTSCFHFPNSGVTISYFMPHDGPDDAAYIQMMALAREHGAA